MLVTGSPATEAWLRAQGGQQREWSQRHEAKCFPFSEAPTKAIACVWEAVTFISGSALSSFRCGLPGGRSEQCRRSRGVLPGQEGR